MLVQICIDATRPLRCFRTAEASGCIFRIVADRAAANC